MKLRIERLNKAAQRRIRAQAAVWVTELHGPDRTAKLEEKVRRWIAQDPRHAAAFERATEAWQLSGGLPAYLPERRRPRITGKALAGSAVLCVAVISAIYWLRDPTIATGSGEQRIVELSDGTQISLNANSRIIVQYDERVRKLILARGEVLFNVIKHRPRPFVVVVGNQKVVATGTSFVVRREEPTGSAFAVTLVEGRVAIEPISWPDILPSEPAPSLTFLNPGERLRFADNAIEKRDSPSIDRVLAWRRGQLIFEDTSLSEAATEFNRYGPTKISIDGPALGRLRVGGVFRIGDPSSFAQAIALAYHLRVINRGHTIVVTDKPNESH